MELIEPRRDSDACLLVSIDGSEKSILIEQANYCAKNLLQCEFSEKDDKNFFTYLSSNTLQSFYDYFDFTDEFYNLSSILSKMRNAKLRNQSGDDIPVTIKVFPCAGDEIDKSYYQLIIRDVGIHYDLDNFRYNFKNGDYLLKTYVDDYTDLMDQETTHKELHFFCSFMKKNYVFPMCIVIIRFNKELSEGALTNVKGKFAINLRQQIREEDEIGDFDDRSICCMMLDFDIHNIGSLLNRISSLVSYMIESDDLIAKMNLKTEVYYLSIPDINFAEDIAQKISEEIESMCPKKNDDEFCIVGRIRAKIR